VGTKRSDRPSKTSSSSATKEPVASKAKSPKAKSSEAKAQETKASESRPSRSKATTRSASDRGASDRTASEPPRAKAELVRADDDTSGIAALLEVARIMHGHPMPATIIFAAFTGEEAGTLGSREFARVAKEKKWKIAGGLNNDMVGYANDNRLDNTIRYSNSGIRDIQHAAAMNFSKLITYDAHYYKGTDAAPLFDAFSPLSPKASCSDSQPINRCTTP
jgi:Zn-dependent M28 family amino/carboxypeptidase